MKETDPSDRAAVSFWTMEAAVALILFVLGAVVVFDSARIGARWADDGPQAGYFPFYIGLILCVTSAVTLFTSLRRPLARAHTFVSVGQLRLILKLLLPFLVFVIAIKPLGIYVASAIFIAYFMIRMGDFPHWLSLVVPVGTVALLFMMFEQWFKVPLPKGPLESLLGLG